MMSIKKYVIILLCSYLFLNCKNNTEKDITSYGAVADGKTDNTLFIQKAIDEVSAAGGGKVVVPKGKFVTGNIELKNGVNLHLETGAELLGSVLRKDYNTFPKPTLIYAKGQKNISITGTGTIDGRGRELMKDVFKSLEDGSLSDPNPNWRLTRPGEGTRTNLLYFEECENVTVKNILCKDATSWVTHYERCRNVTIDSFRLESVAYWNNDGIDIVDCKNVRITNCNINAADDAICLKSARRDDFCDSIFIENCTLRSSANALKFGTGSIGGFKNVTAKNLSVYDTYRSAIALEAVDGGFLENIKISNVKATNTGNALIIRLGHRNNDSVYSVVKNIHISDVKCEVPPGKPDAGYETEGPLLMYPPSFKQEPGKIVSVSPWNYKEKLPGATIYPHNVFPSSVSGLPGHPVENVTLENIEIIYKTVADKKVNFFPLDLFQSITESEKNYPEFSMFGEIPVWGFYVRHVNGLIMKNISLQMAGSDYRSAFLFNDVNQLMLKGISTKGEFGKPPLFFNAVTKVAGSE